MAVPIDEVEQIRDDILILRAMIDAVLDNGGDERMFRACAAVLRDRRELLAWFEAES